MYEKAFRSYKITIINNNTMICQLGINNIYFKSNDLAKTDVFSKYYSLIDRKHLSVTEKYQKFT